MTYPFLTAIFFISVALAIGVIAWGLLGPRHLWSRRRLFIACSLLWYTPYSVFLLGFTGPSDLSLYPAAKASPYKLPWKAGDVRFVAQGNRGFASHRDLHHFAWDFVMANGTTVIAARSGIVAQVEDQYEGIGFASNVVLIEHEDGTRAGYAHIQKNSALVHVGERVAQGQPLALSGMVGQTLFPHLHFFVSNPQGTASIPISFQDVPNGVPLWGHFYRSNNTYETP